jgi:tetratricopeptide (TPR) repeat protein
MSIQYTADQLQRKFQGPPGTPGFPRIAEVLRTEGRLDEAIQLCQEGLQARPGTLSAYLVLGKALMDAGRIEEARDQFQNALGIDPRCLSAMQFLARIMTRLQWTDAAAGYYRSILEVEPWDAEIRALLGVTANHMPPTGFSPASGAAATGAAAAFADAGPAGEETFQKPDGMSGDVLEVNLNDMAADFLPAQDADASPAMGLAEESLEDALSGAAAFAPVGEAPGTETDRNAPPAVETPAEPRPMDVFKPETAPVAEAAAAVTGEEPPISGQDVEDRLDSLFGIEEPPAALRSPTATWTAAPAEAPGPEIPSGLGFAPDAPGSEGSATATGELRAQETGEIPVPPAQDAPEAISLTDYSAVGFAAPVGGTPIGEAPAGEAPVAEVTGEPIEESGRVQGEDIERRLDELFDIQEEEERARASTFAASTLPVAPGPKVDEAVSMGEAVSFGDHRLGADTAFRETEVPSLAEVPPAEALIADETVSSETQASESPLGEATVFASPAEAAPAEDLVTGQDVADQLDNLFGEEPEAKPAAKPLPSDAVAEAAIAAETAVAEATVFADVTPWPKDAAEPQPPPAGDLMSTESMLPPGWFGGAGASGDGPGITGADVEDQLDKLFNLEGGGETGKAAPAVPGDRVNTGDTASFRAPVDAGPGGIVPGTPAPDEDADRTVTMPAMREADQARDARLPKDGDKIKEGVADWLARQSRDADQRSEEARSPASAFNAEAGETMILPADEVDAFGTLAPDDGPSLADTSSIEIVDGADVAGRLDELFADEGTAAVKAEMPLFTPENELLPSAESAVEEDMVSGEDVSFRLQDMFETGAVPKSAFQEQEVGQEPKPESASAESGVSDMTDTDETMMPSTLSAPAPSKPAAPELPPMMDEEEGYPEEEEMPAGSAGANVATVTLAEIYFQQGLREQALQIYRQLLEREPENDSVRKRIEEIEAAKPEGGERGPGSDPRRPRPGLKVPKRKK